MKRSLWFALWYFFARRDDIFVIWQLSAFFEVEQVGLVIDFPFALRALPEGTHSEVIIDIFFLDI